MLVFNSEMHLITLLFILLELMMLAVQFYHYCSVPQDKPRLWYLILLVLLVFYNVTGGFFPDPDIPLELTLQNAIAYGSGFLMAAYFPYYFYKSFQLEHLRFQALFGTSIFLIAPYFIFFVLIYSLNKDLGFAIKYGLIVPFIYSLYLLWAILYSIRKKFKTIRNSDRPPGKTEMLSVYFAVSPWVCLSVFAYFNIAQWIEVTVTNVGFILVTILFLKRSVARNRHDYEKHQDSKQAMVYVFSQKCERYHLSEREKQIALLLCQGHTYEQTGQILFISRKTVDAHVRNIFMKTSSRNKIELLQLLGLTPNLNDCDNLENYLKYKL